MSPSLFICVPLFLYFLPQVLSVASHVYLFGFIFSVFKLWVPHVFPLALTTLQYFAVQTESEDTSLGDPVTESLTILEKF